MKIKNLSFSYNKKMKILENISFEVGENKVIGILGHNGAGKTTLIKCITDILKPDAGNIEFPFDIDIKNKEISYMPQSNGIYENLSVYQNLLFRAKLSKIDTNDIDKYLKKADLMDKKFEITKRLSGGMKKRLSLISCIITKPKIVFLDEPTNSLDPQSVDIITKMILELKSKGILIFINSHDLNFIKSVCEKIIILQNGKKIYDGDFKGNNYEQIKEFYLKKCKC